MLYFAVSSDNLLKLRLYITLGPRKPIIICGLMRKGCNTLMIFYVSTMSSPLSLIEQDGILTKLREFCHSSNVTQSLWFENPLDTSIMIS